MNIKIKFLKSNFLNLFTIVSIYLIGTLLIDFYFLNFNNDYFWCVSKQSIIELLRYPIHCDEGPYLNAISEFEFFISKNNPYQMRPLYILVFSMLFKILSFFNFLNLPTYFIFRLASLILQIIIILLIIFQLKKLLNLNLNLWVDKFITLIVLLIPNIRWNIFFPSHGNLTFLGLLFLLNFLNISDMNKFLKKVFTFSFFSLAHRVFILYGIFYILFNKIKLKISNKKLIYGFLALSTFPILYEFNLLILNIDSFDWNKENFQQFFWILNIFNNKQTLNYGDFCQKFSTFINCNLNITKEFIFYFHINFIFLFFLIKILKKRNEKTTQNFHNLIYISIFIHLFWLFQGWYPNYRFINYSIGYFVFLGLVIISVEMFNKNTKLLFTLFFYNISILYLEPYDLTIYSYSIFSILSIVSYILFIFDFLKVKKIN